MGTVIVGGVIERNGKFLLVQEAKEKCRGKWNIPAGHLGSNETIFDGAKREIKEETGCNVELTGVLQIGNRVLEDDVLVSVIFSTKLLDDNITYDYGGVDSDIAYKCARIHTKTRTRSKMKNKKLKPCHNMP